MEKSVSVKKVVSAQNLVPFVLITSCFALWGFANDITNPMVAAFEKIFLAGTTEATLVQFAFYGGYGVMAFPAALFIRKYSYKKGILARKNYIEGVIAQTFYVGAQIMCWTFIIHYGTEVFVAQGMMEKEAQVLSQQYNIAAMVIFGLSRFICTLLLKYIRPGMLLLFLAIGGGLLTLGCIFIGGHYGLYCLVGISACMSLMFPTIYGIALNGILGDDAKMAAAGLIMAIIGGTFLPLLQASVIDGWSFKYLSGVRASFILPLLCFVVIAFYGKRANARLSQ
jgi:fucose permease